MIKDKKTFCYDRIEIFPKCVAEYILVTFLVKLILALVLK